MVTYKELQSTFPMWEEFKDNFERNKGAIDLESLVSWEYISHFSFYDLTETMLRNWKHIKVQKETKEVFNIRFQSSAYCKDANQFRGDMKKIREQRNAIAHSRKLFSPSEIRGLYDLACQWLSPLGVELKLNVLTYRAKRPRFLWDLNIS